MDTGIKGTNALRSAERRKRKDKTRQQRKQQAHDHDDSSDDDDDEEAPGAVRVRGVKADHSAEFDSFEFKKYDDNNVAGLQTATLIDETVLDENTKKRIVHKAQADTKAKLLKNVVVAAEETEEQRQRKHRRYQLIMGLACLILVGCGATVGALLGTTKKPEPMATLSPTLSPTVKPPTSGGSICNQADPLVFGEINTGNISDSLVEANVDTCGVVRGNGRGVWYFLETTNATRLVLSTCNNTYIDTQISVFSGPSCNKLQCIAGNDQMTEICGNGDQSQLAFFAEEKSTYYVYVHGATRSAKGQFRLSVDQLDDNDYCDTATPLLLAGSDRTTIFGSTHGATTDNISCDGTSPVAPGVWFSVEGIGEDLYITLLADDTGFTGSFYVFEQDGDSGNCQDDLVCIGSWASSEYFEFASQLGKTYLVLVHGRQASEEGDFQLTIKNKRTAPAITGSWSCSRALEDYFLPPGFSTRGGTNGAAFFEGSCGNLVFGTSSGNWYATSGTGSVFTASTCGNQTNFDTQISVFSGSCESLQCVDGNDQACGDQSSISWFSEPGVTYLIYGKDVFSIAAQQAQNIW